MALAREGAEAGTRVVADRQTRGRGRLDHAWESPEGGLYLSIVLAAPARHLSLVPLAVGARLADGVDQRYHLPMRVKWPNDLCVVSPGGRARKLAGILIDAVKDPAERTRLVAGIGLNVAVPNERFSPLLRSRVVSLADVVQPPPSVAEVESLVVERTVSAVSALGSDSVEATLREIRRMLFGVGRNASVDGRPAGVIRTVDEEGALHLDGPRGEVVVRAGDLTVEDGTA
jgi:BirA family transcriptional regulator, biotin operon repressor / biotin---[acetyl-CoA-carboxylase] ligase